MRVSIDDWPEGSRPSGTSIMSKAIPEHPLQWMPKSVWGPLKWRELHCRALAYLPMTNEEQWLKSFIESIPCPKCKAHFDTFIQQNPAELSTRPAFFLWTIRAHNWVNRALEKKELDLEEALVLYSDMFR